MCVVTNKNYMLSGHGEKLRKKNECTVCDGHLSFPFLWWRGTNDIFVCSKCAAHMRTGFVADLIQCTAIREMQALCSPYCAFTLDRRLTKVIEEDVTRAEQEEHERLKRAALATVS